MFGKKKNHTVQPIEANEEVLIQISEPMEITKKPKSPYLLSTRQLRTSIKSRCSESTTASRKSL